MKKKIYSIAAFLFACSSVFSQSFQWVNSGGGTDIDEAYCVALDPTTGDVHITGAFSSTASIGGSVLTSAGATDMFVAKFSSLGSNVWANDGGGPNSSGGHVLTVDNSGNVYVTGEFDSSITIGSTVLNSAGLADIFIAKYNSSGALVWAKSVGGTGSEGASSIRADAIGNIYIAGYFEDTAYFDSQYIVSTGGEDVFAAKYNSFGNVVWLARAGGTTDDHARGIAVDNGNICITGSFTGSALFGTTTLTSNNSLTDVFIARLNPSGVFQWARQGGGTGVDGAYDAAFDTAGNCYITGMFQNSASFTQFTVNSNGEDEIFVAKYDDSGNAQWALGVGGTMKDKAYSIAADPSGTFYITGSFEDTVMFGSKQLISYGDKDIFTACYNSSGLIQWVLQAGGPGFDRGYGLTYDNSSQSLYITGVYEQTAAFGSNNVTSAGLSDLFVAKISTAVGIPDIHSMESSLQIYPNPSSSVIHFAFPHSKNQADLKIYDSRGRMIKHENLYVNNPAGYDISSFERGLYFVELTTSDETTWGRFVKE